MKTERLQKARKKNEKNENYYDLEKNRIKTRGFFHPIRYQY